MAPLTNSEAVMPDAKFLDNLSVLKYLGIVLWACGFAMFFLSKLTKCPEFNGKDKALRCTQKTLIRSRTYMFFTSLLILLFLVLQKYSIALITVALLVGFLLPAYYISIYTKHFLEKEYKIINSTHK
jgi:hypothetical protein